ncbi:LITAF domain-containing protein-like isoform X2 [Pelobates fuscus]|uniref:LITAF domain-containing protein-like isoform X2 n=1 Tax=Pelobates fuscus TaxID=191477 RepID=UPI002FE4D0DD
MYDNKYPPGGNPDITTSQPGVAGGNYPPPPAYGMGPTAQPPVVMAPVGPTIILQQSFHDTPASTTCPSCRQNILTRTVHSIGLLAWLLFGLLLLFGCWLGCCLIPFCLSSCKDVDHYCPNCNHHLYKYKRI